MLDDFQRQHAGKRSVCVGKTLVQIGRLDAHTHRQELLRIDLGGSHLEAHLLKDVRRVASACGQVEQLAARLGLENSKGGLIAIGMRADMELHAVARDVRGHCGARVQYCNTSGAA